MRDHASLIDVVAPTWRQAHGPVRIHRVRELDRRDVTTFRGIPITTVARMFVDLTDVQHPLELANVIHEAAYKGWFSEPATRDAMVRANGRHHLDVLEQAIAYHLKGSAGFRSRGEKRLYQAIVGAELNGVEVSTAGAQARGRARGTGHGRPRTQREDALKPGCGRTWATTVDDGFPMWKVRSAADHRCRRTNRPGGG